MKNTNIRIFDTTLRDGEQSPGVSLSPEKKLNIARKLDELGVDAIETGFPVISEGEREGVKAIVGDGLKAELCGLARTNKKDIDAAVDCGLNYIHTFIATSDIHLEHKLKMSRDEALEKAIEAVEYGKSRGLQVEFSAEDAGRTDLGYLAEVIEAAIEAGATTVNIPDTTGYTLPSEFGNKIAELKKRVSNIDKAIISVHCHDDLGLAVANSLAGIENGARQIECTVNGIGERAGNASLEEIVMALKVRSDLFDYYTDIKSKEIFNTSKMVSAFTGIVVQRNKAIVGENAFSHESGIHQDGVLKNRDTYEIMTPESVGIPKNKIVLGRHSGRHGLKARLEELGYKVSEDELNHVYDSFTELADKKKEIFDDDLRILMGDEIHNINEFYELENIQVNSGTNSIPNAVVKIKVKDQFVEEASIGDGPVDAVFNAIERALKIKSEVESYQVRSVTSGREALGEVLVRIRSNEKSFNGRGISTDIIEASAKAYLSALNQKELYKNEVEDLKRKENLSQAI